MFYIFKPGNAIKNGWDNNSGYVRLEIKTLINSILTSGKHLLIAIPETQLRPDVLGIERLCIM